MASRATRKGTRRIESAVSKYPVDFVKEPEAVHLVASGYPALMERAAQIAALVFAARDAMLTDTPEDLRVSFILMDSAAETLMVRAIESEFGWGRFDRDQMSWADESRLRKVDLNDLGQRHREDPSHDDPLDLSDLSWLQTRIEWFMSPTQIQSIRRNFDDKLRFLAWDHKLSPDLVRVTSRLHEYRNEMYHREETRPDALRIAAHLYALILTQMLQSLPPQWLAMSGGEDSEWKRISSRLTVAIPGAWSPLTSDFGALQRLLAEELRSSVDVRDAREIIGDYIRDRVSVVHENLGFVADWLAYYDHSLSSITELDVIRNIYLWEFGLSLADLRGRKAPVTAAMVKRWDAWASQIPEDSSPVGAFASLVAFESEFEAFEALVKNEAAKVDAAIQARIDEMRGK